MQLITRNVQFVTIRLQFDRKKKIKDVKSLYLIFRKPFTTTMLRLLAFFAGLLLLINSTFASLQDKNLKESMLRGAAIYDNECITCHMENGGGIPGAFPPLAKSDYLMNNTKAAVNAILNGLSDEIVVNGQTYFGEMSPIALSDQEVADVLNFVRNSWGNEAEMLSPDDIKKFKN